MERLGHRRGLDQLRGVAVLIVVVAHGLPGSRFHKAGGVGVALFFVLSGFLITRLLLDERAETNGVSLRAFYLRRARRLLPPLPAALALGAVVNVALGYPVLRPLLAAVTYTANFASAVESHGALNHLWSLAVEEHFYAVWPAVVVLVPRRWLMPLCGSIVVAVMVARVIQVNESLAYQGTQYRLDGMLIGAMLALVSVPRLGQVVVSSAVGVMMVFCFASTWTTFLAWGITATSVASAVLVVAAVPITAPRPLLEHLGRISYGVYLFHFPIFRLLSERGTPTWLVFGCTVAGSLALAEVSWHLIERRWVRRARTLQPDTLRPAVVPSS